MFTTAVPPTPAAVSPKEATSRQLYLQFWFSSTVGFTNVRAAVTSIPIPCGISNSWPGAEIIDSSRERSRYDTRLNALITSPDLPAGRMGAAHREDRVV